MGVRISIENIGAEQSCLPKFIIELKCKYSLLPFALVVKGGSIFANIVGPTCS